jgi:hypothetical protein
VLAEGAKGKTKRGTAELSDGCVRHEYLAAMTRLADPRRSMELNADV